MCCKSKRSVTYCSNIISSHYNYFRSYIEKSPVFLLRIKGQFMNGLNYHIEEFRNDSRGYNKSGIFNNIQSIKKIKVILGSEKITV